MNEFFVDGAGPAPLGSPGGASISCLPGEVYQTPVLDLTQVALGIELVPAKPGYFPVIVNAWWRIETLRGTQATAAQVRAGSDAARLNLFTLSNTPSNSNINSGVSQSLSLASLGLNGNLQRLGNTPVYMDLASGAIGTDSTFALTASFAAYVLWLPVP